MWKHPEAFAHIPQDRKRKTLDENVALAEQLAKEHDKLPGPGWLQAHSYSGLCSVMRSHPEAFAHIPQDSKKLKTLAEHVRTAKQLAKARQAAHSRGASDTRLLRP